MKGVRDILNDCREMAVSSYLLDFCFFAGGKLSNLANLFKLGDAKLTFSHPSFCPPPLKVSMSRAKSKEIEILKVSDHFGKLSNLKLANLVKMGYARATNW